MGWTWHAVRLSECVNWKSGAATLLTLLLLPGAVVAGQDPGTQEEDRRPYSPISPDERAEWVTGETVSLGALGASAFTSAWTTTVRQPREWRQSAGGYGRRFADAQAATAISKSLEASLGSLWGEDPRYFRSAARGRWARVRHAMTSVALARRRDGRRAPAWGRLAGSLAGSAIENTWLPPSAATRTQTTVRVAAGFGGQLASNLWAEFWPDLRQRLPHKLRRSHRD
jgi:hypothetical protein